MEVLEKVNRNESDVSMKTLISFGMGSLGNNIICAMIGTYLTIYLTDSFGISAAAVVVFGCKNNRCNYRSYYGNDC